MTRGKRMLPLAAVALAWACCTLWSPAGAQAAPAKALPGKALARKPASRPVRPAGLGLDLASIIKRVPEAKHFTFEMSSPLTKPEDGRLGTIMHNGDVILAFTFYRMSPKSQRAYAHVYDIAEGYKGRGIGLLGYVAFARMLFDQHGLVLRADPYEVSGDAAKVWARLARAGYARSREITPLALATPELWRDVSGYLATRQRELAPLHVIPDEYAPFFEAAFRKQPSLRAAYADNSFVHQVIHSKPTQLGYDMFLATLGRQHPGLVPVHKAILAHERAKQTAPR